MKLTDTQLVLLSAAAQRQDGGIEIGPKLKGNAAQKVLSRLLSEHFIEEIPFEGTLPVWRRNDNEGALALRITERGLTAIGVDQDGAATKAGKVHHSEQTAKRERQRPQPRPRHVGWDRNETGRSRRKPATA